MVSISADKYHRRGLRIRTSFTHIYRVNPLAHVSCLSFNTDQTRRLYARDKCSRANAQRNTVSKNVIRTRSISPSLHQRRFWNSVSPSLPPPFLSRRCSRTLPPSSSFPVLALPMRVISRNKNDAPSLRRSKFVVTKIRFIARSQTLRQR